MPKLAGVNKDRLINTYEKIIDRQKDEIRDLKKRLTDLEKKHDKAILLLSESLRLLVKKR
ncbi:hypothetical protein KKB41_03960 [Patescibacteria group bacterium]|nr:hypothetical protein [Patescibacteria group bacterium]